MNENGRLPYSFDFQSGLRADDHRVEKWHALFRNGFDYHLTRRDVNNLYTAVPQTSPVAFIKYDSILFQMKQNWNKNILLGDCFQKFDSAAKGRRNQVERIGSPRETSHRVHVFDLLDGVLFPLSLPRIERQNSYPYQTNYY